MLIKPHTFSNVIQFFFIDQVPEGCIKLTEDEEMRKLSQEGSTFYFVKRIAGEVELMIDSSTFEQHGNGKYLLEKNSFVIDQSKKEPDVMDSKEIKDVVNKV